MNARHYTDLILKHYGCKQKQCPVASENAFLDGQTERRLLNVSQILPNSAYVIPHKQGYTAFMTSSEGNIRIIDDKVAMLEGVDMFVVHENQGPNGQLVMTDQMMQLNQHLDIAEGRGVLVPGEELRKSIEEKLGKN